MFGSRSQPWREALTMETITRLREERAQIAARLAQIDNILRQYDELDQEAKRLLMVADMVEDTDQAMVLDAAEKAVSVATPTNAVSKPDADVVKRNKTPMKEFEAAVLDVMRENNRPMDRVDLYDALTSRGIVIGDGDRDKELNTLSARVYRMAKDGHLVSQRGEGYRLRSDEENLSSDPQDAHSDMIDQQETSVRLPDVEIAGSSD